MKNTNLSIMTISKITHRHVVTHFTENALHFC